jgi:hypothetical protein
MLGGWPGVGVLVFLQRKHSERVARVVGVPRTRHRQAAEEHLLMITLHPKPETLTRKMRLTPTGCGGEAQDDQDRRRRHGYDGALEAHVRRDLHRVPASRPLCRARHAPGTSSPPPTTALPLFHIVTTCSRTCSLACVLGSAARIRADALLLLMSFSASSPPLLSPRPADGCCGCHQEGDKEGSHCEEGGQVSFVGVQ